MHHRSRCRSLVAILVLCSLLSLALCSPTTLPGTSTSLSPKTTQSSSSSSSAKSSRTTSSVSSSSSISSSSSSDTESASASSDVVASHSPPSENLDGSLPFTTLGPLPTSEPNPSLVPEVLTPVSEPEVLTPVSEDDGGTTYTPEPISTSELPGSMSPSSVEELNNLMNEFFEWKIQEFPEFASNVGINDKTAGNLESLSHKRFKQRRLKCEDFLLRAKSLNTTTFAEDDHLNLIVFMEELNTFLQNFGYLKFFAPINFLNGPQHLLKRTVKRSTVLKSLNDFHKLVLRYRKFPQQAREIIDLMKDNIENRLMPSKWSLIDVENQLNSLLVPFNESVFFEPFLNISINITEEERHILTEQAKTAVEELLSSFRRMRDFFKAEYFPSARPVEGVSSLPGGMDYYKACLKFHTSTDLTPQQVHDMGLREVDRIGKEVAETAIQLSLPNKTLAEISRIVKNDTRQLFTSEEDLLSTYRDAVYNVLYPAMDRVVNEMPNINVSVEENISGAGYASYGSAPKDGSRPGTFFINTKIYEHHARYEVTALSLHEAVPGHHLQFATLLSNPSIPDFRKYTDYTRYEDIPAKFPLHTAYVEGWGLYSEFLGNELGLYDDPYQRIGRHSFESLRACRLVVDTGLHALGWTRQEAIDYLLENTAMSETAIKTQIDRYITWPGQACSYKVGEIRIKEMRQKAEKALGELFRVQDFHEVVLGCAAPLDILEQCINSYITTTAAN